MKKKGKKVRLRYYQYIIVYNDSLVYKSIL